MHDNILKRLFLLQDIAHLLFWFWALGWMDDTMGLSDVEGIVGAVM